MDERRANPALIALAVMTAALLLYVAGFFGLSNPGTVSWFNGRARVVRQARFFPNDVWANIYCPAAAVESVVRQKEVLSTYQSQ